MRCLLSVLLVAATLTLPLLAAEEEMTLEQAIAQAAKRESSFTRDDLTPTQEKLLEQQGKLGAFDAKTIETRTKLLRLLDRRDELLREESGVLGLQKVYGPRSKVKKTFAKWVEESKPKTPIQPKSDSPALKEYDYSAIDKHVADVPKSAEASIKALGAYLKKGAKNDREKARAVAKWMLDKIAYDLETLEAGKIPSEDPSTVFRQRAAACGGHATLYEAIGRASGLDVITITGLTRSTKPNPLYRRITTVTPSGVVYTLHGWNAVRIDKRWYLVDTTLQNGRMKRKEGIAVEAEPRWSSFLLPPERRIHTHLPKNEKQQFLTRPISRADQERLPLLEEGASEYAVKPISHQGPFASARDELVMTFEVPRDVVISASFVSEKGRTSETPTIAMSRDGTTVQVRLSFSKAGTYELLITARKRDDKPNNVSPVVRYGIVATSAKEKVSLPDLTSAGQDNEVRPLLPQAKTLKAGEKVQFLVYLPKATQAIVYCSATKEQVPLTGKDGYFAGEAKVAAGDVYVMAHHPGDEKGKLWGVIRYKAE